MDSVAGKTGIVTLVKADVGLSNVDNTADVNKSVSIAANATSHIAAVTGAEHGAVTTNTADMIVRRGASGQISVGDTSVTGAITSTGNITAYYSDSRLKDFHGTIPDALAKVLSLNGYYFTENDVAKSLGCNNDQMQVGVSAQEVEKVMPEVVASTPIVNDQNYKAVWYDKLIPLLIEAIKEQQIQIEELKRR